MEIWNRKALKLIRKNWRQTVSAVILTASGFLTAGAARYCFPLSIEIQTETDAETLPAFEAEAESAPDTTAESEPMEDKPYEPSIDQLNLAYAFPEGADSSDGMESYAGRVYQDLMVKESEWIGSIYDLAETPPAAMAARLGKDAASVCGDYNPGDSRQDPDNPATWLIGNWKRVNITFYNGDGALRKSYSNVQDILSMASVYTYVTEGADAEVFEEYADHLWEKSRSYTVSISSVYYCDGCLDQSEEEFLAEQEAEELAVSAGSKHSGEIEPEESDAEGSSGTETLAETAEEEQPETSKTFDLKEPDDLLTSLEPMGNGQGEPSGMTIRKNTVDPTQWDHVGPGENPVATPGNAESLGESQPNSESFPEESAEGETLSAEGETSPTEAEEKGNLAGSGQREPSGGCPGHVDLNISVRVLGLNEKNGLAARDEAEWNTQMLQAAKTLAGQDWYQQYGLSISSIHMRDALSSQEIESYMKRLPEDLSQERREIVYFALSSVGKVPYYWGGKASGPGYEGNAFGTLVTSDVDGRILKGLDCSGWINWVYWSVTGKSLGGQSTSSLALCGRSIRREELQPGDIILKTGTGAHVVMFLDWEDNGQMLVIHESSTAVNNVTLKVMTADWPYYRNLID